MFNVPYKNENASNKESEFFRNQQQHNGDVAIFKVQTQKNNKRKYKKTSKSLWSILVAVVLICFLMGGEVRADGKKSVTRDNFKHIITELANNNVSITALNFDFKPKEEELKELHSAIEDNTELGHIAWAQGQIRWEKVTEIEKKLVDNNKNYRDYPNDYIHGLLSDHAYVDAQLNDPVVLNDLILDEKTKKDLEDWHVVSVHNKVPETGYYGVIYQNDKTHQVVLANRGTEGGLSGVISDLSKKHSDWNTNQREIYIGKIIVCQQAMNYAATGDAIEIAKKTGYRLSFTGHSLGAWLAELSAFYSYAYFNYRSIKAVTFDSPGALPMMEKLQSNIKSKDTQVKLEAIDVVTYLARPNFVNSCNSHVGKVYRVIPEMKWTDWINNKIPNFIKTQIGDTIKGVSSFEGHDLIGILATFDPQTGKPTEYKRMADWPRIKYMGEERDFSIKNDEFFIKTLQDAGVWSSVAWSGVKVARYLLEDSTLMTLVDLILNYKNINMDEYWAYFENIDGAQDQPLDKKFALIGKAKYREDDINIMDLQKGQVDTYLYDLYEYKGKLKELSSSTVQAQLEELLAIYTIQQNGQQHILLPESRYNVENIRQRTRRLLHVLPKDLQEFWQGTGEKTIHLLDNLPTQKPYYTEIRSKKEELSKKLSKDQIVVLSGAGGMGKTTLAAEYGETRKQEGGQVRWIEGTAIERAFLNLAQDMNIPVEGLGAENIRDSIYYSLLNFSGKQQILFIFDNIEGKGKIEPYLKNLPNHMKVLVTARDSDLLEGIKSIHVKGFEKGEAMAYLSESLEKNAIESQKLVTVVGESPFRLSKVVAYLKKHSLKSVDEFLQEYEEIKKGRKHDSEIYPEVELLFRDLKKECNKGWRLLKYLAYLDAEGVPIEFTERVMGKTKNSLQELVNKLEELSLVEVVTERSQKILKVSHRIIQEETKKALIEENQEQSTEILKKLIAEVDKVFPYVGEKSKNWKEAAIYISHAKHLIQEAKDRGLSHVDKGHLLPKIGAYTCHVDFNYNEGINYWKEVLDYQRDLYKGDSPNIAATCYAIGRAHHALGGKENLQKALEYHEEALNIYQKVFPGNDPLVARSLNGVGMVYQKLGGKENFEEALQYYKNALMMYQEVSPGNASDVSMSLSNVGMIYQKLGGEENLKEALHYQKDALEMAQKLSDNDFDVARLLNNLGSVCLEIKGERENGIRYLENALEMYQNMFPTNHPSVALLLNNIGVAYSEMHGKKNLQGAILYLEDSLKMYLVLFPGNYPDVANVLFNIAITYDSQGDWSKSLEYAKQAYSIYANIFTEDHPKIKMIRSCIESLQPDFFAEVKLNSALRQDCLVGNNVGSECRWILTSRGQIDRTLLKIKQKIQKAVLNKIVQSVDDYGWNHDWFGINYGVKGYVERIYLKKELQKLGQDDRNIEIAQMLCFEAMNLGIMKSKEKPYKVVESFTQENSELIKKIAIEHPEFFVDGSIVEACIRSMADDKLFEEHILKHVKYMGMDERREQKESIDHNFREQHEDL